MAGVMLTLQTLDLVISAWCCSITVGCVVSRFHVDGFVCVCVCVETCD